MASPKKAADNFEKAIDGEDSDADDEYAEQQRALTAKRREARQKSMENRIQMILPFPFAPNVRPLGASDLESIVALQNAAYFDAGSRVHPDQLESRLKDSPELTLGLFCTVVPHQAKDFETETFAAAHLVETGREDQARSVLMAYIIASASNSATVQDFDRVMPADSLTPQGNKADQADQAHHTGGQAVWLHSLAVSPKLQGCGLGKLILKSFLQQMQHLGIPRVSLISQDYLVSYFKRFGFKYVDAVEAKNSDHHWHEMIVNLATKAAPKQTVKQAVEQAVEEAK